MQNHPRNMTFYIILFVMTCLSAGCRCPRVAQMDRSSSLINNLKKEAEHWPRAILKIFHQSNDNVACPRIIIHNLQLDLDTCHATILSFAQKHINQPIRNPKGLKVFDQLEAAKKIIQTRVSFYRQVATFRSKYRTWVATFELLSVHILYTKGLYTETP